MRFLFYFQNALGGGGRREITLCIHDSLCLLLPLQMGTNKCASQAGMNAYGTRRHLYDPKAHIQAPMDNTTISLQMGTNKGASQVLGPISNIS